MIDTERNIRDLVGRLERVADRLEAAPPSIPSMNEERHEDVLLDVVRVLEETKSSFRSRKLKELRERLEVFLTKKQ